MIISITTYFNLSVVNKLFVLNIIFFTLSKMPYRSGPRSCSSLYIKNIPNECVSDDLRELFRKFGKISDVYVPTDYFTKVPRGFAYVQFDDRRDAKDARHEMNNYRLFGNELEIDFARSDRKTPREMKNRSGDSRSSRHHHSRDSNSRSYSRSRSRSHRRHKRRDSRSESRRYRRRYTPSRSPSRDSSFNR
ncbi:hypothetical protein A3Q56_00866, partial [Intoshia linei]